MKLGALKHVYTNNSRLMDEDIYKKEGRLWK